MMHSKLMRLKLFNKCSALFTQKEVILSISSIWWQKRSLKSFSQRSFIFPLKKKTVLFFALWGLLRNSLLTLMRRLLSLLKTGLSSLMWKRVKRVTWINLPFSSTSILKLGTGLCFFVKVKTWWVRLEYVQRSTKINIFEKSFWVFLETERYEKHRWSYDWPEG